MWRARGCVLADKAWAKSREAMMNKIGLDNLKDPAKVESRAKEVFAEIDTDGNQKIDKPELTKAMINMGVTLKEKEVKDMMNEADEDGCAPSSPTPPSPPPAEPSPRFVFSLVLCLMMKTGTSSLIWRSLPT